MKSIVPVVMAGVLGIYGLIIAVIISTGGAWGLGASLHCWPAPSRHQHALHCAVNPGTYTLFDGFAHLASGLACGLAALAAGMAIGIVGDAGVRCAHAAPVGMGACMGAWGRCAAAAACGCAPAPAVRGNAGASADPARLRLPQGQRAAAKAVCGHDPHPDFRGGAGPVRFDWWVGGSGSARLVPCMPRPIDGRPHACPLLRLPLQWASSCRPRLGPARQRRPSCCDPGRQSERAGRRTLLGGLLFAALGVNSRARGESSRSSSGMREAAMWSVARRVGRSPTNGGRCAAHLT